MRESNTANETQTFLLLWFKKKTQLVIGLPDWLFTSVAENLNTGLP